jgi:hypothetical protein
MPNDRAPPNSRTAIRIALVTTLVVLMVAILIYISRARVQGIEFNPNTWAIREFNLWADPITNRQLSGVVRNTSTLSIDPSITAHIKPSPDPAANRWDLVKLSDFHTAESLGPAAFLVNCLVDTSPDSINTSIDYWNKWSVKHPTEAAAFWPALQKLAIHQGYLHAPEIFDLASSVDSQFDQRLNAKMTTALLETAKLQQSSGDLSGSKAAAQAGLAYSPNNPELLKLAQ